MADDKDKPSGQPPRAGRRPPPTLDLKATELAAEAAAAEPPTQPEPEVVTVSEMAEPEPPEPPQPGSAAGPPPPPPARTLWPIFGAAAGGGLIVAIVMLLLFWRPGADTEANQEAAAAASQQAARIAALETSLRTLTERRPPAAADANAVAAMSERLAALEAASKVARPPISDPSVAERLAALDKRIAALADDNAALKRRSDAATEAAQAAQRRADVAAAKAETAQKREARADEHAVRLAVVADMLKAAVGRGDRFRVELDAALALAPDPAPLAPLAAFADTGVPTAAALAQRLRAVLPAMRRAAEPETKGDAGFLTRLQASAERLVRIQPVGERQGDSTGAVLARAEAKAGRGEIAGALAELERLPPAVRAPAADWIKAAQARDAALGASQRFAAAHVSALARQPE